MLIMDNSPQILERFNAELLIISIIIDLGVRFQFKKKY